MEMPKNLGLGFSKQPSTFLFPFQKLSPSSFSPSLSLHLSFYPSLYLQLTKVLISLERDGLSWRDRTVYQCSASTVSGTTTVNIRIPRQGVIGRFEEFLLLSRKLAVQASSTCNKLLFRQCEIFKHSADNGIQLFQSLWQGELKNALRFEWQSLFFDKLSKRKKFHVESKCRDLKTSNDITTKSMKIWQIAKDMRMAHP